MIKNVRGERHPAKINSAVGFMSTLFGLHHHDLAHNGRVDIFMYLLLVYCIYMFFMIPSLLSSFLKQYVVSLC